MRSSKDIFLMLFPLRCWVFGCYWFLVLEFELFLLYQPPDVYYHSISSLDIQKLYSELLKIFFFSPKFDSEHHVSFEGSYC